MQNKKCPECNVEVPFDTLRCPHCQYKFTFEIGSLFSGTATIPNRNYGIKTESINRVIGALDSSPSLPIAEISLQEISIDVVKEMISSISFKNDGDAVEKEFGDFLKKNFPNCEIFWQKIIVPATERVTEKKDEIAIIQLRLNIDEIIETISALHYSMFVHLVNAHHHRQHLCLRKGNCSFEDFYIHLVTVCDLAEDLIIQLHLLISQCLEEPSYILTKLTKEEFLKNHASPAFDKKYDDLYNNYLNKGKGMALYLPSRPSILKEFFKTPEERKILKNYLRLSKSLREYRNIIVHNIKIGRLIETIGQILVPKLEKIQKYKKWSQVWSASTKPDVIKEDFIEPNKQMEENIIKLENLLNKLWNKLISDMEKLLFVDKNKILLKKYSLSNL